MVAVVPDAEGGLPPHLQSIEAEQYVIGSVLIEPAVWPQIAALVSARDFSRPDHRAIYGALEGLAQSGQPIDTFAVIEYLREHDALDEAGGAAYIAQLVHDTPTAANVVARAQAVRERSLLRDIAREAARLERSVLEGPNADAAALLDRAGESFTQLRARASAPARQRRAPMDWEALEQREIPVRQWRISYWLTAGPTLFAGAGGVGKTMIAQTIATALALGRRFIDDVHGPTTVLMWACEDEHDELWRRQAAICRFFDVPLSALKGRLIIEPRLGRENTLFDLVYGAPNWTPLRRELIEQVNDYRAGVLFLDNIGQTYGGRENDRHHVTMFLNGLMGLTADPAFSAVVMGHPSKAADSEFSGSTAWENGVRMRWYMGYRLPDQKGDEGEPEDPTVRYLAKRKANYSEKDYRKLILKDGIFVPESDGPGEFSRRYGHADRLEAAEEAILHGIAQLARIGQHGRVSPTSPDYLPKKLHAFQLSAAFTIRELRDAMNRLLLANRILEVEVGKKVNRTPRLGLVVAP